MEGDDRSLPSVPVCPLPSSVLLVSSPSSLVPSSRFVPGSAPLPGSSYLICLNSPKVPTRDISMQYPSHPPGGSSCSRCPFLAGDRPHPFTTTDYLCGCSVAADNHSVLLEPDLPMVSTTLSYSGLFWPFH